MSSKERKICDICNYSRIELLNILQLALKCKLRTTIVDCSSIIQLYILPNNITECHVYDRLCFHGRTRCVVLSYLKMTGYDTVVMHVHNPQYDVFLMDTFIDGMQIQIQKLDSQPSELFMKKLGSSLVFDSNRDIQRSKILFGTIIFPPLPVLKLCM